MSLYTFGFLAFLFFVVFLYYISPHRFRWAILLIASGIFYLSYSQVSAIIIALVILVSYFIGLQLGRLPENKRGSVFWVGVLFNIGLLLFYKFAGQSLAVLPFFQQNPTLIEFTILPIGLSFHALQAVSYLVEVSRGNQPAERHMGIFALSILFFPRVLAGPIERPSLLGQFKTDIQFDYKGVTEGMKTLAWGFFKKMVIADRLIPVVNMVYIDPTAQSGVSLFYATLVFAFAIYADFSGYSDIALGCRTSFRDQAHAELPQSVFGAFHLRVLATLAYLPLELAQGLHLLPSQAVPPAKMGKQSAARRDRHSSARHHACQRTLARHRLDIPRLGRSSRGLSRFLPVD